MRIVLGSDHRLFVDAMADALARNGMTVVACGMSGQEVLGAVARYEPDICLLGASFKGSSSLDVLRLIRKHYPATKVVVFSDSADPAEVSAAIDGGAAGFISKEQHMSDVIRTLVRVRAGEQAFDDSHAGHEARKPGVLVSPDCLRRMLTFREQEVLMLMMEGESTKQIARSLAISLSTARTHVQSALVKLGAHSRLEASSIVARSGLLGEVGQFSLGQSAQAAAASG
ncbi:MAG TPA: response regulator transcription factor [Streptosporangiaceae bacterium]|nr:response regulator transcription factor [Streptosporangiaceae bacterium]